MRFREQEKKSSDSSAIFSQTLFECAKMKNPRELLTLKQFMLKSEVVGLYRKFMKMGRLIEDLNNKSDSGKAMRTEWEGWVRSEFRVRSNETDEEAIRILLLTGSRQLRDLERSIRIANG